MLARLRGPVLLVARLSARSVAWLVLLYAGLIVYANLRYGQVPFHPPVDLGAVVAWIALFVVWELQARRYWR